MQQCIESEMMTWQLFNWFNFICPGQQQVSLFLTIWDQLGSIKSFTLLNMLGHENKSRSNLAGEIKNLHDVHSLLKSYLK